LTSGKDWWLLPKPFQSELPLTFIETVGREEGNKSGTGFWPGGRNDISNGRPKTAGSVNEICTYDIYGFLYNLPIMQLMDAAINCCVTTECTEPLFFYLNPVLYTVQSE
jgi:hypothetical protein